ncbi:hypothetical protein BJ912DRAFT_1000688 [Pholiota molesta]|nr:hypothetical protein BJ912DRAFT_1000688 [Pholiota molesta]
MSTGNSYPFFFDLTDATINDADDPSNAPAPAVAHPYPQNQTGTSSGTGSAIGPIRSAGVPSIGSPFAPYTRQRPQSTESRGGQVQPQASNVSLCKRSLISAGQIVLMDRIHHFAISTDHTSFTEEWDMIQQLNLSSPAGGQMGATVAGSAGSSSNPAPPALMYVAPIPLLSLQIITAPTLRRREMRQARECRRPSITLMPKQSSGSHLHH